MARPRKKPEGEQAKPEDEVKAEVTAETKPEAASEPAVEAADKKAAEQQARIDALESIVEKLMEANATVVQKLDEVSSGDKSPVNDETIELISDVSKDNEYLRREVAKLSAKTVSEEEMQKQGYRFLEEQFKVTDHKERPYQWKIRQSPFRSDGRGGRATHSKVMTFYSTSPSVEIARHEYSLHSGAMLDESNSHWEPVGFVPGQEEGTYSRSFV